MLTLKVLIIFYLFDNIPYFNYFYQSTKMSRKDPDSDQPVSVVNWPSGSGSLIQGLRIQISGSERSIYGSLTLLRINQDFLKFLL
jgi:hypothetical protein